MEKQPRKNRVVKPQHHKPELRFLTLLNQSNNQISKQSTKKKSVHVVLRTKNQPIEHKNSALYASF
jgi:hypothetical protein